MFLWQLKMFLALISIVQVERERDQAAETRDEDAATTTTNLESDDGAGIWDNTPHLHTARLICICCSAPEYMGLSYSNS